MTNCKANKGTQRVNMETNHTMRQKQKVFVRLVIYKVKNATCQRKKKCKCPPIKTKKTVMKRNGTNEDTIACFIIDTSGTKIYKFVKIKCQFPDKCNRRSPIYYIITKRAIFKTKRIDNIFPDKWNGRKLPGQ